MTAKEFLVAVTAKLTGEVASLCAESHEGSNDVVVMEGLEAKSPIVSCSTIDKNQSVFVTTNRHTVAKGDINVDNVKIFGGCAIDGFTSGGLGNSSKGANGCGKFTVVHERAIFSGMYEMSVISELAATCDPM